MASELGEKLQKAAALLRVLHTSARAIALYKPDHPAVMPVCERAIEALDESLDGELRLRLELRPRSAFYAGKELPPSSETEAFACALHSLGVGSVTFTKRLTCEGLLAFFPFLAVRPDEAAALGGLRQAAQLLRIDGLELEFVEAFIDGSGQPEEPPPGRLSAAQVEGFCLARNLPDLLTLLLRQNEGLTSPEAQDITDLLCGVLKHELALEEFAQAMPWDRYDPRIRRLFEDLAAGSERGSGWRRDALISWAAALRRSDAEARKRRREHAHEEALLWSWDLARGFVDHPANESQARCARRAYARLFCAMAEQGRVIDLFQEHGRLNALDPALSQRAREALLKPAAIVKIAKFVQMLREGSSDFSNALEMLLFLGRDVLPPLLEEMAASPEGTVRVQLLRLLAILAGLMGDQAFLTALEHQDWTLAVAAAEVLAHQGNALAAPRVARLLRHGRVEVRESAVRALLKLKAKAAGPDLAAFLAQAEPPEAARTAQALAGSGFPSADDTLISAFRGAADSSVQRAIVEALGRLPTPTSRAFLEEQARQNLFEFVTGRNKELRQAVQEALESLRRGGRS